MDDNDVMERLWSKRGDASAPRVSEPAAPEVPGVGLDDIPDADRYEAFKVVDKDQYCLSIYTGKEPANGHASYQYFQYLMDDKAGRIFDIVYGFFVVRVRGRNLLPVVRGIKSKKCVFIQEYQRRAEWPEPKEGEPKIEKIEFIYKPDARTALLEKGPQAV